MRHDDIYNEVADILKDFKQVREPLADYAPERALLLQFGDLEISPGGRVKISNGQLSLKQSNRRLK